MSSWGASGRAQWASCVDHSRRGDALLWRGLLSHRGQTAFTDGTQGHKEKNCILKDSILSSQPLGVDCGCLRGSLLPGEK